MSRIISIDGENVSVGLDDGSIREVNIASCSGFQPQINDEVEIFEGNGKIILTKVVKQSPMNQVLSTSVNPQTGKRKVNKIAYVLLAFFLGGFGVHKFFAGKILQGVFYLIFFWTCIPAIIAFVEFIIALCKPEDENGQIEV